MKSEDGKGTKFYKFWILPIMCITIVLVGTTLYLPKLVQLFLDNLLENQIVNRLILITYFFFSLVLVLLKTGQKVMTENYSWLVVSNIRNVILSKILKYDYDFFNKTEMGELLLILNDDIYVIQDFIKNTLVQIITGILTLSGIVYALAQDSNIVSILFLIYLILSVLLIITKHTNQEDSLEAERTARASYVNECFELYQTCRDIVAYGKRKSVLNEVERKAKGYLVRVIDQQKALYSVWIHSLFVLATGEILTLCIGGTLALNHIISLGTVYLYYSYSKLLKSPFRDLQTTVRSLFILKTSTDRIKRIMNYSPSVQDGDIINIDDDFCFSIRIKKHEYNNHNILENISFDIKPNDIIGIVGESGSGKSTLCRLICKKESVQDGEILLNGINISRYSNRTIENDFAYVTGEVHLLHATLRENLTFFNYDISERDILDKLDLVGLSNYCFDDLDLKKELNNVIDNDSLSLRHRQLINILRLLFIDKKIIILDEAFTQLDITDDNFCRILKKICEKKIVIIVTHEMDKTIFCNKIISIEKGNIRNVYENKDK